MNNILNLVDTLNKNRLDILLAIFGGCITLTVAYIGIRTAFKQLARQFEHKVIYEGWKDLQEKLFKYSSALSNFDGEVQSLRYFIQMQDNTLVNGGNKQKYRQEKWSVYSHSYINLQKAYVDFLRSFENHEVIFLKLNKMKNEYQKEQRTKVEDNYQQFSEKVFPEMYGKKGTYTKKEIIDGIDNYWMTLSEMGAFLDDFRREMQNDTVGRILNKQIPNRKPNKRYRILTRRGFKVQK